MTCPTCDTPLEGRCPECGAGLSSRSENETFEKNFLIIGEGEADRQFFSNLLADRGILKFEATNPANGKAKFGRRLKAIRANARYAEIQLVLLVRDSDENPDKAFQEVQEQIREAGGYGVPKRPLEVTKVNDAPGVAVLLLPWIDKPGCLESLLIDVLGRAWPTEMVLAEKFIGKCPTGNLQVSGRAKAVVGAMFACVCRDDPSCSVSSMWRSDRGFRRLLPDKGFDQVANFIKSL